MSVFLLQTQAVVLAALVVLLNGCDTTVSTRPSAFGGNNSAAVDVTNIEGENDTRKSAASDVVQMTDLMLQSMLECPDLIATMSTQSKPAVIIDGADLKNRSTDALLKTELIADRLRSGLSSAASSRLTFISAKESTAQLINEEFLTKGEGPRVRRAADYRMTGSIRSHEIPGKSNYMLFEFNMINLRNGVIVWSDKYEFKKAGIDSIGYDR